MSAVPDPETLRYPVGRFRPVSEPTPAQREGWISDIRELPRRLGEAVAGLDDGQLDTPYREGGWTVRQVVHHLPDSHVNAYVRFCLALTEEEPTIRPYDEAAWAELPFSRSGPVQPSLMLLEALHGRWSAMIGALEPSQLDRVWIHPDSGRRTVSDLLNLYAWHCRHHVGHITSLRARMGW